MGCCSHNTQTSSPPPTPAKGKEEILLQIPNSVVHYTGDPGTAAVELGRGDFTILNITENSVPLAIVIRVGKDLSWPLTKDEPVVKLDQLHYLFTVTDQEGGLLNFGVTFAVTDNRLVFLDQFLREKACFSAVPSACSSPPPKKTYEVYWKEYAPNIEDYNGLLAKAIAQGTGEIVKGIFKLSNAYSTQIQKGASLMQPQGVDRKNGVTAECSRKRGGINKTLRRVRRLSEMTETISRALLNGVLTLTGNAAAPLAGSKAGKYMFATVPGEAILASLDAVAKVLDATEIAERRALVATSDVVVGAMSKKFGKSAGDAADDVFATTGHAIGTAWNIFKVRKAFDPKSSVTSAILNSAGRKNVK